MSGLIESKKLKKVIRNVVKKNLKLALFASNENFVKSSCDQTAN